MKRKTIIMIGIGVLIAVFISVTIGLFEIPDSYHYIALGDYLYKGRITIVAPFNYTIPQTLFAPIYALLVYYLIGPHAPLTPIIFIPFLQLLMVLLSTILFWKILQALFPKKWVPMGIIIFLLLPFHLLYAMVMMSETLTILLYTLFLFIAVVFRKKPWQAGLMVTISGLLTLTRYAMLPTFVLSALFWLLSLPKHKAKQLTILSALPGLIILSAWILLHVKLHHTPLLSTHTGRHLYNNVVKSGNFLPSDRSDPRIVRFLSYVPKYYTLLQPWWDIQPVFGTAMRAGEISEIEVDRLFLAFSIEAIKSHPLPYLVHVLKIAAITPNTPVYYDNILTQLGFPEPECTGCGIIQCRFGWFSDKYCKPVYPIPFLNTLFGYFILANKAIYPYGTGILFLLSLVGIGAYINERKILPLILVGLFLTQHLFQSASEWAEGRFMLPMYPIYTILILKGVYVLFEIFSTLRKRYTQSHAVPSSQEE